jgi:hypothetical protein
MKNKKPNKTWLSILIGIGTLSAIAGCGWNHDHEDRDPPRPVDKDHADVHVDNNQDNHQHDDPGYH